MLSLRKDKEVLSVSAPPLQGTVLMGLRTPPWQPTFNHDWLACGKFRGSDLLRFFIHRIRLFLAIVMSAIGAAPAIADATRLSDVSLYQEQDHTIFAAALSEPVAFSVSTETNPNRVTIELNGPATAADQAPVPSAGLVSAYHIEQGIEGHLRIVLDTKTPTIIQWSTIQAAGKNKPPRLTVDLAEAAADTIPNPQTGSITAAQTAPTASKPKFIIAIDPGHGGIDPGASSADHVREKDVVLAFGLALKAALEKTDHYTVVMTRDDDKFISLADRVKMARDAKADLLIAVHADTVGPLLHSDVRGTTIYTVSDEASDTEAEALAQKENRADIISGMDMGKQKIEVANVLINLAQRESKSQALMFAKQAVNEIRPVTELTSKPMRSAAFVVLKAPDVPSVLVELGYLSNAADTGMLISPKWREEMAVAMTRAIDRHFAPLATAAKQ